MVSTLSVQSPLSPNDYLLLSSGGVTNTKQTLHFQVQKCYIRFLVVKVLGFFRTSLFVSEERCGRSYGLRLCWPHRLVIDVNRIVQSPFSQQKATVMLISEKVTPAWSSMVLLVFAVTPIFGDALDHGQNISSRGTGSQLSLSFIRHTCLASTFVSNDWLG